MMLGHFSLQLPNGCFLPLHSEGLISRLSVRLHEWASRENLTSELRSFGSVAFM